MEHGTVRAKLRAKAGASLVLAMAVLLAAVLFSMAIITGSVNAAKAARGQYETEQSYLCVSAAARLVNQEILYPAGTADGEMIYKKTASVTHNGGESDWPESGTLSQFLRENEKDGFAPGEDKTLYRPVQSAPLSIRELLSYLYERCEAEKETPVEDRQPQKCTLTINIPLDGGKGRIVNAALTMQPDDGTGNPYRLTVLLSSAGGTDENGTDEKTYPVYKMQLEYDCTVKEEETARQDAHYEPDEDGTPILEYWETVSVTTTTLTWELKKVGRGS